MQSPSELGDRLHEALFNSKKKEKEVIEIISNTDLPTRLSIAQYYETAYGNKLQDDLNKKLSSKFRDLVIDLFLSPTDLDVEIIKRAVKGFGVTEVPIVEILTSRPKWMIDDLKVAYKNNTGKELSQDLEKKFSGNLKRNILTLLNTDRSNNTQPNKSECENDSEILKKNKESSWFDDQKIFDNIFAKKSGEELVIIARYYYKKTGVALCDAIEKKMSGKNKSLFNEILFNNINPSEMFADKIYSALKGIGTDTNTLNRILSTRNEIDMVDIREIYFIKYNKKLIDAIKSDTSGPYQSLCMYLSEK
jgi:3-dehydroquinate dehydratase